MTLGDL